MNFLFKLILFVFAFLLIMPVITRKFANPYRLYLLFGKKGSGKFTYWIKLAIKYVKKGYTV